MQFKIVESYASSVPHESRTNLKKLEFLYKIETVALAKTLKVGDKLTIEHYASSSKIIIERIK